MEFQKDFKKDYTYIGKDLQNQMGKIGHTVHKIPMSGLV